MDEGMDHVQVVTSTHFFEEGFLLLLGRRRSDSFSKLAVAQAVTIVPSTRLHAVLIHIETLKHQLNNINNQQHKRDNTISNINKISLGQQ